MDYLLGSFHLLIILLDIYLLGHSFIEHLRRYVLKDRSQESLGLDIGQDKEILFA